MSHKVHNCAVKISLRMTEADKAELQQQAMCDPQQRFSRNGTINLHAFIIARLKGEA